MVTITETPETPEVTQTEGAEDKEKDTETMFRLIAARQWKTLVRLVTNEVASQCTLGNMASWQRNEVHAILGVPAKPDREPAVTVEFSHTHKVARRKGETKEQFLNRVKQDAAEYVFYTGDRVETKCVDVLDWPEEPKPADLLEGLDTEQILAKIEATRAALHEWARVQHHEKNRWCSTGAVNGVLMKLDLEPLAEPKTFELKVPVSGEATYRVKAVDADAALAKLRKDHGAESGTYTGSFTVESTVDLNQAVVTERGSS